MRPRVRSATRLNVNNQTSPPLQQGPSTDRPTRATPVIITVVIVVVVQVLLDLSNDVIQF